MSTTPCPSVIERVCASVDGADDVITAHIAECPACRSAWASDQQLRALAASLPEPPAGDVIATRAMLLARAQGPTRQSPPAWRSRVAARVAAAALSGVAAAAAVVWLVTQAPTPSSKGAVHVHGVVDVVRLASLPNEVVRLTEGAITVEVAPLRAGERFRVVTSDAEVEVRGTAFDIVAVGDQLQSVRVLHGLVEVRPAGGETVLLSAGERWTRPTPTATATPTTTLTTTPTTETTETTTPTTEPSRTPSPSSILRPRAVVGRVDVAPAPTSTPLPTPQMGPDEIAYAEGWSALRDAQFHLAAESFARVLGSDRTELHEDAGFWRAVALARSSDPGARAAFQRFLQRFPDAARAGEASVALGWIFVEAGGVDDARAAFRRAVADPSAAVRASAQAGLAALDHVDDRNPR